jgi:hypothetical protein
MRFPANTLTLAAVVALQGCYAFEALGGRCLQEQLTVTFPVTITRGSTTTSTLLTTTITPSNLDQTRFARLRQSLVEGTDTELFTVTWMVPAFDINGGMIAFTHTAPLSSGETQQVTGAFDGGGWGADPAARAILPAISVRADNFTATKASGSITVLNTAPLRLRIDVTTLNDAGETIRITGEAGFHYDKVTKPCIS